MEIKELLEACKIAESHSYSPYSNFKVGAICLMKDGKLIEGCNVENASYGLTNCAERSAMFHAISVGYKPHDFEKLIVMSKNAFSPCGACRQVIVEMFEMDKEVIVSDENFNYYTMKVSDLLPSTFGKDDLHE